MSLCTCIGISEMKFLEKELPEQRGMHVGCYCCSATKSCLTLWPHGLQHTKRPCPPTVSQSLPKFMSLESVMLSNHLILCHPLLLPSVFPSIRVFSSESALHIRWPKYWSFSFSIRPSNEYSGFISIRIDWFDLLAVMILVDRCCLISFQKWCTSGYSPQ